MQEKKKTFPKFPKRFIITLFLLAVVIYIGGYSYKQGEIKQKLVYADNLSRVAAVVNGEELTLRSLAFYVAYEEGEVQKQAIAYDPDNPKAYWNTYTNFTYIRKLAKEAALQMAIHDEIFYQMAMEEELTLNEEEQEAYENALMDFWDDLVEEEKDIRLGVSREDIADTLLKMTLAQKMQLYHAEMTDRSYEDYGLAKDAYKELLDKQSLRIYKDVWSRVDMGNVTLVFE